jgi:hypothetical protein
MCAEQELHGTCHKTIVYAMLTADRYPQMHLVMLVAFHKTAVPSVDILCSTKHN